MKVMILNIDSIILRRNKKVLFSNLSLNLPKSQILILKGSNGVGKSSLLEAICGLVEIDNVDPVARLKNIRLHLRVPTTGLMTKMDTSFQ